MTVAKYQRLLNSLMYGQNGQESTTSDYRGRFLPCAVQHLDSEAHRDLSVTAKARQSTFDDRFYFQIWHLADGPKLPVVFIEPFEFRTSGLLTSGAYEQGDKLLLPRGERNPAFQKLKRHFMLPEHLNQSIIHLRIFE